MILKLETPKTVIFWEKTSHKQTGLQKSSAEGYFKRVCIGNRWQLIVPLYRFSAARRNQLHALHSYTAVGRKLKLIREFTFL